MMVVRRTNVCRSLLLWLYAVEVLSVPQTPGQAGSELPEPDGFDSLELTSAQEEDHKPAPQPDATQLLGDAEAEETMPQLAEPSFSDAVEELTGSETSPRREREVKYSHDPCSPPLVHEVRQAVRYLPRPVYNTHYILLPSTRLLTMVEPEVYPRAEVVDITETVRHPPLRLTRTVVLPTERTLRPSEPAGVSVTVHSTKLHLFTRTSDLYWTKTRRVTQLATHTHRLTSTVHQQLTVTETRIQRKGGVTTETEVVTHTVTATRTSTSLSVHLVTETTRQYRYVPTTQSPVVVTQTVTRCRT